MSEKKDDEDADQEDQSNTITEKIFIIALALFSTKYYMKRLLPLLLQSGKTGIEFFNTIEGLTDKDKAKYEDVEKDFTNWIKNYSETQIEHINSTTKKQAQRIIKNGLAIGDNYDKIADNLFEYIKNTSTGRAKTIAETEVHNAVSKINFLSATYKDMKNKTWCTMEDYRVRPAHVSLDGITISIGEEFLPGLSYPGDSNAPPSLTVLCRCWLTYS